MKLGMDEIEVAIDRVLLDYWLTLRLGRGLCGSDPELVEHFHEETHKKVTVEAVEVLPVHN